MQPRSLLHDAPPADARPVHPTLAKGFRPFFWLAAVHVALVMPAWMLALAGKLTLGKYFGSFWHAHEMVFGFTVAVIAGFLLTAVGNWTRSETAIGAPLAGLALLWIAGRVGIVLADHLPKGLPAALDLAFLPGVAIACALPIVKTRNARNYQFLGMLAALFAANLGMHLGALGVAPAWIQRGAWLGVYFIVVMMLVMTARILPMFTKNATRVDSIRNIPRLDRAAVGAVLVTIASDLAGLDARIVAAVAALAGVLVFARAATWGAQHTLKNPLLWVLHAGHAFIGVGLLLRAASPFVPAIVPTVALHAWTAGAVGLLTLGMMSRVSLGHTGRMLAAKPLVSVSFVLVLSAAVIRVLGPLFGAKGYLHTMITSGTLFSVGFLLFLIVYTPILAAPRVDGKPG